MGVLVGVVKPDVREVDSEGVLETDESVVERLVSGWRKCAFGVVGEIGRRGRNCCWALFDDDDDAISLWYWVYVFFLFVLLDNRNVRFGDFGGSGGPQILSCEESKTWASRCSFVVFRGRKMYWLQSGVSSEVGWFPRLKIVDFYKWEKNITIKEVRICVSKKLLFLLLLGTCLQNIRRISCGFVDVDLRPQTLDVKRVPWDTYQHGISLADQLKRCVCPQYDRHQSTWDASTW